MGQQVEDHLADSIYQRLGHAAWVQLQEAAGATVPDHMRDIPPASPRPKRQAPVRSAMKITPAAAMQRIAAARRSDEQTTQPA